MPDLSIFSTPESAVRQSIDGAGGAKVVGTTLRPEWDTAPDTASRWLSHCCTDGHRSKLGLRQLAWIFKAACRAGQHTGFRAFAHICGYEAHPITAESDLIEAVRRAESAKREAQSAANDLQTLTDNPRLLATMRKAGLKVGDL